jgi:predicted ester cyclase
MTSADAIMSNDKSCISIVSESSACVAVVRECQRSLQRAVIRIAGRAAPLLMHFEKMTELAMQAEEDSKSVVREYVEAFNRGDLQRLKELFVDDAEIQGVKGKGTFEKVQPVWRQLIDGYGIQLKIEGLIAEGNTVAVRYLESGTFRAPAFGNQPTGRSYQLVAMEWFEMENGRIKRRSGARDAAAQARQLGIAPAWQ